MQRWRRIITITITGAVLATVTTAPSGPAASAAGTFETFDDVPGNPSCADSGLMGFKVEGVPDETSYDMPGLAGAQVTVTAVRRGGREFDWVSDFGIDQVIVKGGSSARVYPEYPLTPDAPRDAREGTGFRPPDNASGGPPRISHVEFCYDAIEQPTISADTGRVAGARGVAIDDIPLTELPASLVNTVAGADLVNDAGTGLRFSGTGLRFIGTSLRFSGTGLRFIGTGLRFSGTSIRFSGTGLRFIGTGLRFTGTGLRFSDTGVGTFVALRSAGTGLRFTGTGLRFIGTGMRFSDLPAWDVPLSELQPPEGYTWNDVFAALDVYEGFPAQNVTFGQLMDALDRDFAGAGDDALAVIEALASMSLLDLDPDGAILRNVSLVALLLGGTPLTELQPAEDWCALIDCTESDPGDTTLLGLNLAGLRSSDLPLDEIPLAGIDPDPDSVLADLLDDPDATTDLVSVPAEQGDSLADYLVRGIDALNVPWEQLPLIRGFDVRQYALGGRVTFTSEWAQIGTATTPISVTPSDGFVAAERPHCEVTSGTCEVVSTGEDSWDVTVSGGTGIVDVTVTVAYRPAGLYDWTTEPPATGSFDVRAADATLVGHEVVVFDPWAGEDPPPIDPDVLYFGAAGGGDIDSYDVDVSDYQPGSHVAVRLSNLSDDADLVLYRSAGTGLRFSGTGMRFIGTGLRFSGTGLRYSGESGDSAFADLEPETLEDVPIAADALVEDVSANRATTPEAADGFTSSDTDEFRVQVSGFNQAETQYVVRVAVTEFADACSSDVADPGGSITSFTDVAGAAVGTERALVLAAPGRTADWADIDAAVARLADVWPVTLGTITGPVPDWTSAEGFCSVEAANAVAEQAARDIVDEEARRGADFDHVVIIGGDDVVPFYRTADTALIANEASYASTVGGSNAITSALGTQHVLTDDIYGDRDPWPFLNRLYFTPDRSVGRLVESTADIVGQIDRFIASDGRIDAGHALTGGYDFLSDVATEIDANLADVTSSRSTLISDAWTADQLAGELATSGLSIAAIQAHMDQGLLLSAAGDAQSGAPSASEVVGPDELVPDGLTGALLFTAGCHAGLNQPYADAARTDDWAQALGGGPAAFYLANTGYGYGLDFPAIGYTEELLERFSDNLELGGLTVGEAARLAKSQYFAGQLEIDPYDEKSQMQLTVYGLPMYSIDGATTVSSSTTSTSTTAGAATAGTPVAADPVTGQPSSTVDTTFQFGAEAGPDGTSFYSVDSVTGGVDPEPGHEISNGNPIQPKVTFDVTADDPTLAARGAVIEQMASTRADLDDPTIARATVDNTTTESPAESGVYVFPTAFTNVHTEETGDGPRGRLVVVPGQYDSTKDAEQLLIESAQLRTYYSPEGIGDVVRPRFERVSAGLSGAGDTLFRVEIDDPCTIAGSCSGATGTGVERVLVQFFDGTTWHPVEMFPADADATVWSGGLAGIESGQFFVQAIDGAGNVAVTTNKGLLYGIEGLLPAAVAFVSGTQGDGGWYVEPPTVRLVGDAVVPGDSHTYTVNGSEPAPYTDPFTIDTDGVNTVQFFGPGAPPIELEVKVDTLAPSVVLDEPIAVLRPDDTPDLGYACTDPTPGSGLRDLTPGTAGDCLLETTGYDLTVDDGGDEIAVGPFDLATVIGQDVAGNSASADQNAVVVDGTLGDDGYFTTAVILGVVGPDADDALVDIDHQPGDTDAVAYAGPVELTTSTTVQVIIGDAQVVFDVDIDTADPTVTITAQPSGGTYEIGTSVTITCDFADAESGLGTVACGGDPESVPDGTTSATRSLTLDTSTLVSAGTVTASATDAAGRSSSTTFTYDVVDTRSPTITLDPTTPGGTYEVGDVVTVTCDFTDPTPGSGLASVACGGPDETLDPTSATATRSFTLDTSTPGTTTFSATATDAAGNTTTTSTYTFVVEDPLCDPAGDATPDVDIVRCRSAANGDGTATLSIIVTGDIATEGVQYRLRLAADPSATGDLVKWSEGKTQGQELLAAGISGDDPSRLDFLIDLDRVGVAPGGTLYWFAEVQDGVKGKPTEGFLDRAPDEDVAAWFELVT